MKKLLMFVFVFIAMSGIYTISAAPLAVSAEEVVAGNGVRIDFSNKDKGYFTVERVGSSSKMTIDRKSVV